MMRIFGKKDDKEVEGQPQEVPSPTQAPIPPVQVVPPSIQTVTCPICGKVLKKQGLGPHLSFVHGVKAGKDIAQQVPQSPQPPQPPQLSQSSQSLQPAKVPFDFGTTDKAMKNLEMEVEEHDEGEVPRQFLTRSMELELTPVSRPIRISPVVLLCYDYARNRGYNGELGDFITECVTEYLKRLGIRVGFFKTVG